MSDRVRALETRICLRPLFLLKSCRFYSVGEKKDFSRQSDFIARAAARVGIQELPNNFGREIMIKEVLPFPAPDRLKNFRAREKR